MSRVRIEHPSTETIYARAGVDHAIGMFAEIFREDRIKPVASVDVFELGRAVTMSDVLGLLVEFAFFTEDELHDALVFLQDGSPKPRDMRVVNLVVQLKSAADGDSSTD